MLKEQNLLPAIDVKAIKSEIKSPSELFSNLCLAIAID